MRLLGSVLVLGHAFLCYAAPFDGVSTVCEGGRTSSTRTAEVTASLHFHVNPTDSGTYYLKVAYKGLYGWSEERMGTTDATTLLGKDPSGEERLETKLYERTYVHDGVLKLPVFFDGKESGETLSFSYKDGTMKGVTLVIHEGIAGGTYSFQCRDARGRN